MNYTKKMVLVPFQDGEGRDNDAIEENITPTVVVTQKEKKENSIRKYAVERQRKLLAMILKLAQHGGYDADGMIATSDGSTADIVPLIMHASSPGRNVKGMTDFVRLLHEASVPPDLVINLTVREMLEKRIQSKARAVRSRVASTTPTTTTTTTTTTTSDSTPQHATAFVAEPPASLVTQRPSEQPRARQPTATKRKRNVDDDGNNENLNKRFSFDWDQSDSDLDER